MNKITFFAILLTGCAIVDREAYITAKFSFVNQTQDTVLFYQRQCFNANLPRDSAIMIFPSTTVIFYNRGMNSSDLENYNTVVGWGCAIQYGIGSDKCDHNFDRRQVSFTELQHYEVKKEISRHNYEFVYYLTEAKKEAARPCNLGL